MSKLLLYCTKAKPYLNDYRKVEFCNKFVVMSKKVDDVNCNGKIVAECDYEVEEIKLIFDNYFRDAFIKTAVIESVLKNGCLTEKELLDYLKGNNGYAIHIKNLHIFDKPKELSDYYSDLQRWVEIKAPTIKKAPQNMCYAFDDDLQDYILISIRPEWLCKILNSEKTIEVRKKVLKEMLE